MNAPTADYAAKQSDGPITDDNRVEILITTDESDVIEKSIAALAADPNVFQRGGMLVRVTRDAGTADDIRRDATPTISRLPTPNLRERLTRHCRFTRRVPKSDIPVNANPTNWLVNGIDARGEWPSIPRLTAVSDTPVLRPDGSILQVPGHDPITCVLFEPSGAFPQIPVRPTRDDARRAIATLADLVVDFPFVGPEHRAAWIAGLLTPFARFAYSGCSPAFLVGANVMGSGKTLLIRMIGWAVLGGEIPVASYSHDPDEMGKRITTVALAGDRIVLLDNISGPFGNDALDRALTSNRWSGRILGRSEKCDLPMTTVWYGSGNNPQTAADTMRRIVPVQLDVLDEHPEQRTGFKYPHVIAHVERQRPQIVAAALTVLSAYFVAGRPSMSLSAFGSFEGWSDLVRSAVVWAGEPDPCLTREQMAAADSTSDILGQLIHAWRLYDPHNLGLTMAEVVARLYPPEARYAPTGEADVAMRAALEAISNAMPGRPPGVRTIANRLRALRRRVVGGRYFDIDESRATNKGAVWQLRSTERSVNA